MIFSLVLLVVLKISNYQCANINSLDALREHLRNSQNATLAFYSTANLMSNRVLFQNIDFNYEIIANETAITNGVESGKYEAGSVVYPYNEFNVIGTGIVSGKAIFTLPDYSTEYPHGATEEKSGKDFRNALNLAITKMQASGTDFVLASQYKEPIIDIRTCKLNKPDEFPVPNRKDAVGILKEILESGTVLVGCLLYTSPSPRDS